MITKHFFKVLMIFTLMIILGLMGVFAIDNLGGQGQTKATNGQTTGVAK